MVRNKHVILQIIFAFPLILLFYLLLFFALAPPFTCSQIPFLILADMQRFQQSPFLLFVYCISFSLFRSPFKYSFPFLPIPHFLIYNICLVIFMLHISRICPFLLFHLLLDQHQLQLNRIYNPCNYDPAVSYPLLLYAVNSYMELISNSD